MALNETVDGLLASLFDAWDLNEVLQARIARYEHALQFYADGDFYHIEGEIELDDNGKVARDALQGSMIDGQIQG